jgi:hypothetical protein
MDMISFGTDIGDPLSTNEEPYIPTPGKVWQIRVALLEPYGSK